MPWLLVTIGTQWLASLLLPPTYTGVKGKAASEEVEVVGVREEYSEDGL